MEVSVDALDFNRVVQRTVRLLDFFSLNGINGRIREVTMNNK